jgi:hypothetical protein
VPAGSSVLPTPNFRPIRRNLPPDLTVGVPTAGDALKHNYIYEQMAESLLALKKKKAPSNKQLVAVRTTRADGVVRGSKLIPLGSKENAHNTRRQWLYNKI